MKQVSIIIVTYNSERDIFDCVRSIEEHADIPKQDIELIIVDNCSTAPQPMFECLRRQWGEDIVCIENTRNGGYGQGNNVGIHRATAPVILIVNPDVRLLTPFLHKPLQAFKDNKELSMYGMKQMLSHGIPSKNSFACTKYTNGYFQVFSTALCNRLDWYIPSFMYLSGSCFFVRKNMFEQIGLFDENVFMYGEECDIHYRLKRTFGAHVYYDKTIRYIHLTKDREPDIHYEEKLLEADLYHYTTKNIGAVCCLRNYLRINNALLARLYLRKWLKLDFNKADMLVRSEMIKTIKNKLAS